MGDGVTGPGSAPASQTTNAGQSGTQSPADDPAKAVFGETLKQEESLCPAVLSRRPPDGCTYLRNPSQPSKPVDLRIHGDIPNLVKGPTNDPNGPDYSRSIPQLDSNPLSKVKVPDWVPSHNSGLGPNGHIFTIPVIGTPHQESPDQTPYKPPR